MPGSHASEREPLKNMDGSGMANLSPRRDSLLFTSGHRKSIISILQSAALVSLPKKETPTKPWLHCHLSEGPFSVRPRKTEPSPLLADDCRIDARVRHGRRNLARAEAFTPYYSRPNWVEQEQPQIRPTHRHCMPEPHDMPPKRDAGIASEKEWGIDLKNGQTSESGVNEDGSSWYRESGEDIGENGYGCRWTVMGGRSDDNSSEWKEAWWEKSDWTGYKELGAEKSGKNAQGDSWWETWQEIFQQDEWSNLARIERSAQKQAKSGNGTAGWFEKWWEKYNAKGWTEKGAHKSGKLNDQSWWEKWGEQFDGQGTVLKWTDKWAENDKGAKWGDKWEEKFLSGVGTRQGETWHISPNGERWSRTWGEEHFGNGKVHKYGKSTSDESWDAVVNELTIYESEPHYGWADVIGDSTQLLGIECDERPPGVFLDLDFSSLPSSSPTPPTPPSPPQFSSPTMLSPSETPSLSLPYSLSTPPPPPLPPHSPPTGEPE